MSDYFEPIEIEITQAKQLNPEVVFPWSWWKEKASNVGMSPNALYTRAVKSGLYVPPNKREENLVEKNNSSALDHGNKSATEGFTENERETLNQGNEGDSSVQRNGEYSPDLHSFTSENAQPLKTTPFSKAVHSPSSTVSRRPTAETAIDLQASIQGLASLYASTLDKQVNDLAQALEEMREENRRLRVALRQLESLTTQMGAVYRTALTSDLE